MIKIPATLEGIPAIEATIAAGINVNVTLIFSLDRYDEVIEAYLDGPRAARGRAAATSSTVASVASFFVSRVDTETDRRLPEGHPLRGKAAVANAKLAYAAVPRALLRRRGGTRSRRRARGCSGRCGRRRPRRTRRTPPTLYVDELIGPDTVNTLAPASIDALQRGEGDLRADTVDRGRRRRARR